MCEHLIPKCSKSVDYLMNHIPGAYSNNIFLNLAWLNWEKVIFAELKCFRLNFSWFLPAYHSGEIISYFKINIYSVQSNQDIKVIPHQMHTVYNCSNGCSFFRLFKGSELVKGIWAVFSSCSLYCFMNDIELCPTSNLGYLTNCSIWSGNTCSERLLEIYCTGCGDAGIAQLLAEMAGLENLRRSLS